MEKKIVGILICTLLICTAFSVSGQAHSKKNLNEVSTTSIDDDVPTWEVGYSWTYTGETQYSNDVFTFELDMEEACFCVTDDTGDMYDMAFGGAITGFFSISDPDVSFEMNDVTGNMLLTKSNLDYKEISLTSSGMATFGGNTLKADATITIVTDIPFNVIDFPISVNKTWVIPAANLSIDFEILLLGIIPISQHFDIESLEASVQCVGMETVSAGGKTYDTYNISYGGANLYYAPSIGNWVLFIPVVSEFTLEIIATSYPGPDNPLKSQTPDGPTDGNIGTSYEYTTNASDPNGDQIKYGWDWDGDMIPDEWTDYYDSNESITTSHIWDEEGSYNIRVRARDATGLEGEWSDPLSVTMPVVLLKTRFLQRPLVRLFLEKLTDRSLK